MKPLRTPTGTNYSGPRCMNCGQPLDHHHVFTTNRGEEQWVWLHRYTQSQCNHPQATMSDIVQPRSLTSTQHLA